MDSANGNPAPTAEQQALATQQATTTANLNLEENEQRKVILNALSGMRQFRGSALSRSVGGNNDSAPQAAPPPGPSGSQINSYGQIVVKPTPSLIDTADRGGVPAGRGTGNAGRQGNANGGGNSGGIGISTR